MQREISKLLSEADGDTHRFRLYMAGMMPWSAKAITAVLSLCNTHFHGRYELEVIDLFQQPELGKVDGIVVAPTLVRTWPHPVCRAVGNPSDVERLQTKMDLRLIAEGDMVIRWIMMNMR